MKKQGYVWLGAAMMALDKYAKQESNPKRSIGVKKLELLVWLWGKQEKEEDIPANRRILSEQSGLTTGSAAGIRNSETLIHVIKALSEGGVINDDKTISLIIPEDDQEKNLWIGKSCYVVLQEGKAGDGYQFGVGKAHLIIWMWDNKDNIPVTNSEIAYTAGFVSDRKKVNLTVTKTISVLKTHDLIEKKDNKYILNPNAKIEISK